MADFVPFLDDHGIELSYDPLLTDEDYSLLASPASPVSKASVLARSIWRARSARPSDGLLLVHRLMLLTAVPGIDPPARVDVYDFDDALFVGSPAEVNRSFQWLKQEARRAIAYARRARLVIAANPTLAEQARRYATHVEVVPSCVDPSVQPLRDHADSDEVTIGWIGSHTTSDYLKPVLPVLERLNARGVPAKLVIVGGDRRLQATWIEHRDWTLTTQATDLASFDIGIMPLPDDDWARGKSGYKLLQYFAAGVPAIASPVGLNRDLVSDERGVIAEEPGQWYDALHQLISDVDQRRELGRAARSFVEDNYSYQRWAPELAGMLRSLD